MKGTRWLWASIGMVLFLVVASLIGFATGALKPQLGLDLEGGVSVILQAPAGTPDPVMQQALENIRNRVDAFGVGEPQIFVSGTTIEVQLPGLAKGSIQQRSKTQVCLIGGGGENFGCVADKTAAQSRLSDMTVSKQGQFCLSSDTLKVDTVCFGSNKDAKTAVSGLTVSQQPAGASGATGATGATGAAGQWCVTAGKGGASYGCFDTQAKANAAKDGVTIVDKSQYCLSGAGSTNLPCGFDTHDAAQAAIDAITVTSYDTQYCVLSSADVNLGCFLTQDEAQRKLQDTGQSRLLDLIGTTARLEEREVLQVLQPGDPSFATQALTCDSDPTTDTPNCSDLDPNKLANEDVWFIGQDGAKYHMGKVLVTGDMIKKATAVFQTSSTSVGGWQISFDLTKDGSGVFGDVTTQLQGKQLAIILDSVVISAPTVQSPITNGTGVITGSFTEQRAKDLATVLNAGALPVQLTKLQTLTVSPTLGKESLKQGVVAGIVGLLLLFLYLLFYYRLLGVVAIVGMTFWAILAMALVSLAGIAFGYSLTLAGIAGLAISLGVTADSYIVFFERLKDEVRNGKTPRSAVQPAFKRAYRTIVAADMVTGIAAVVLYLTAVSSVRGFALTLGVATLLDLFVVYFFKRPTVFLIARSPKLVSLRGFGLESGVASEDHDHHATAPVPVAGGVR
ncbi:MAG: protein translocase subunit SecD [Actinomycetota bacterium]